MYSYDNTKGHGVSKIIFGESGLNVVVLDLEGKYTMTHCSMAIQVSSIEESNDIKKALLSEKFKKILESSLFSSFRIDGNIFTTFKNESWREL